MAVGKLKEIQISFCEEFDKYSEQYFYPLSNQLPEVKVLFNSIQYSLNSGGKRFRPFVSHLVAQAYNIEKTQIYPYALAIEMIHTYSLIHDDLPCMDNDDFRRGQPTNHKLFGEDMALLAGDSLLTESFAVIAREYENQPALAVKLIRLLTYKAGMLGMIGGQVLDMKSEPGITKDQMLLMHKLKTGALIESAVVGAAHISKVSDQEFKYLQTYGENIGLAFQLKDDILDMNDKQQDHKNFVSLIGITETQNMLNTVSVLAQECLINIQKCNAQVNVCNLLDLIEYNIKRDK